MTPDFERKKQDAPGDGVDDMVKSAFEGGAPPEVERRLRGHLEGFRVRLRLRPRTRAGAMPPWLRLAAVFTVTVAALFAGAGALFWSSVGPSWAEVVEQFGSTDFFHATIYAKRGAVEEPVQLELWVGHGGKMRMRAGHEMFFGKGGQLVETVDMSAQYPGDPGESHEEIRWARSMVEYVLEEMGARESFTLEALLETLPGMSGMRAVPHQNPSVTLSHDLVVFDLMGVDAPDRTRIWALRRSRLPVRILYWDPRSGASVDVSLSYTDWHPREFYHPEAFAASLENGNGNAQGAISGPLDGPGLHQ